MCVRIEFGANVQTHEKHTNDMTARTIGAYACGPQGMSRVDTISLTCHWRARTLSSLDTTAPASGCHRLCQ